MSKLIAESVDSFINETKPYGFQRGLDPRAAMGTGYVTQINKWLKDENTWGEAPSIPDQIDSALERLIYKQQKDFVYFIITTYRNYNKNKALSKFISYSFPLNFIDEVIEQGARFINVSYDGKITVNIPDKQYYIEMGGTLVTLTPEEKLTVAVNTGNFDKFKNLIENGVKLKLSLINALFKHDYNYDKLKQYNQEEIKQYLRDHDLEQIIMKKDIKKIDKIKILLAVKKSVDRQYPHGYKIYRILKWIDNNHPTSSKEISKFVWELGHGAGTFNPLLNSSYWLDGIKALVHPNIDKKLDGSYYLNVNGMAKFAKLEKKFGTMKIDPPPYI